MNLFKPAYYNMNHDQRRALDSGQRGEREEPRT